MSRGVNTALSPARQVSRLTPTVGTVSHPSPDGGISGDAAGPIIQSNWENMRDAGMSGEDATARLHGNLSIQMPAIMTDPVAQFIHSHQPRYTNSYGPVADILNARQVTVA